MKLWLDRIIKLMFRILRLGAAWSITLMLLSTSAVILTFLLGWQETIFGYISYAFSAYALTAFVFGFSKIIADIKESVHNNRAINRVKAFIYNNEYGNRYMTDISYKMKVTLYTTLSFNVLYAAFKLIAGIHYASFWYGADALFYLVLSAAQFFLLRHVRKHGRDLKREYRQFRFCGYLLFVLNATLVGVVYQIVNQGMGYRYPGLLIYIIATYAFINITVAFVNLIKYRKYKNPVYSAQKIFILAKALVSMFALQSAMFASFNEDEALEQMMNTVTGGAVCTIVFGIAVFMVIWANKKLHEIQIM